MSDVNINVTLPDGSALELPKGSNPGDVAAMIGPGLAKAALAAQVDGRTVDLMYPLEEDVDVRILTAKDPEALEVLRHSAAHVMAQAVLEKFPDGQIAIGPPISDGFYYDFDLPRSLTPDDLVEVEDRMREIIAEGQPFEYEEVGEEQAREIFAGQVFKQDLIDGLVAGGEDEYGEKVDGPVIL